MRELSFNQITIKHFRSFTEAIVYFPKDAGLRFLGGENLQEPRLGANGAGKTSFWDALYWGIYGTSIRGGRTSSCLTWGRDKLEILIELCIGNTFHSIKRTGPPMKIELNGVASTQEEIDTLIGLSGERFLHAVIFGQGMPMFPDLSVPERGQILDEVLDLAIWNRASEQAVKKATCIQTNLTEKQKSLAYIEGQLATLQTDADIQLHLNMWEVSHKDTLDRIALRITEWQVEHDRKLIQVRTQIGEWERERVVELETLDTQKETWRESLLKKAELKAEEIDRLTEELKALNATSIGQDVEGLDELEKAAKFYEGEIRTQTQIQTQYTIELENLEKSKSFWVNNLCPTCAQPITQEKREHEQLCIAAKKGLISANKESAEALLKLDQEQLALCLPKIRQMRDESVRIAEQNKSLDRDRERLELRILTLSQEGEDLITELDSESNMYSTQQRVLRARINPYIRQEQELLTATNDYVSQLDYERGKVNPFIAQLTQLQENRVKLTASLEASKTECTTLQSKLMAVEYWKHGFKRIRLFFVQQVLEALQIEIRSSASSLGLDGWLISLNTESETKSGTMKLGVQISIKSPLSEGAWDVWSGGETQRLRLAIAMGLSSLIQRAAGVYSHLEVWDEPTRGLSGQGVEDLLEALRYRAESLKKQIWITDHSALTYSGFSEIWNAIKDVNGRSSINRIAKAEI